MKILLLVPLLLFGISAFAQPKPTYQDSLKQFVNDYVTNHGVVKDKDTAYLRFSRLMKKREL